MIRFLKTAKKHNKDVKSLGFQLPETLLNVMKSFNRIYLTHKPSSVQIYIYIYIYVCVCVCVSVFPASKKKTF